MSFSQFFAANWLLFLLLFIVLAAIAFYEFNNRGKSGQQLSNIAASAFINNGALLLDTRTAAEYKAGHIAGAKHVGADKFADYAQSLNLAKDKPIIVYCQSGLSSRQQANFLTAQGFSNVYQLKSGIDGWKAENLPLV